MSTEPIIRFIIAINIVEVGFPPLLHSGSTSLKCLLQAACLAYKLIINFIIFSTYSLEQDYSHTNQTRTYCRLPQQKSSSYPDSTL